MAKNIMNDAKELRKKVSNVIEQAQESQIYETKGTNEIGEEDNAEPTGNFLTAIQESFRKIWNGASSWF